MKWEVEYKHDIHGKLQIELDENYELMERYMNKDIEPKFNRNKFNLWGRVINVTSKIKERINEEITKGCMFRHKNIKKGLQEIEFRSYIDVLPKQIKAPFMKMLTKKINNPLRKEFGKSIISIKEVE